MKYINMKYISAGFVLLFCCVIVFFSLFGEKLYYSTKPAVEAYRIEASLLGSDGQSLVLVPKEAIFEDKYVYVVSSEPGFSLTIETVERREVVFADVDEDTLLWYADEDSVLLSEGLRNGEVVVVSTDRELEDGQRVNITDYL